ncbi:MAG: 5-formyltetrahydrofolate cyclo-ligase [Oscillospiraceae bacterium]
MRSIRRKSIYGYMSYNQEVRTMPILRQAQADGKRVAVPKVYGDEMKFLWLDDLNRTVSGAYSIPEPVGDEPEAADETALILMPGLAFDPAGHRCGYGGGFYDKYLAAHKIIRRSRSATASRCMSISTWTNLTSRWTR